MLPPLLMVVGALGISAPALPAKPNVVMIAIDDLNDWVGCLGGHPLAKTPHIDALARRGTLFTNAHCQSPLCNPSRTSLLLSLRPTTTGIYGLAPFFRQVPAWSQRVTLPQHFARNGYRTLIGGKVFHGGYARNDKKEATVWGPASGIGVRWPSGNSSKMRPTGARSATVTGASTSTFWVETGFWSSARR